MSFTFRLINKFDIDYASNTIRIYGKRWVLDERTGVDYAPRSMDVTVPINGFCRFCRVCISSEQGESKSIDLRKYNVSFFRRTYDNRYFNTGDLQLAVGEIYILYEILMNKIDTTGFKIYDLTDYIMFIDKSGNVMLSDNFCLHSGFFFSSQICIPRFSLNVNSKSQNHKTYGDVVNINNITSVWLEKGACHPYINLKFRDMVLLMSFSLFCRIQNICSNRLFIQF